MTEKIVLVFGEACFQLFCGNYDDEISNPIETLIVGKAREEFSKQNFSDSCSSCHQPESAKKKTWGSNLTFTFEHNSLQLPWKWWRRHLVNTNKSRNVVIYVCRRCLSFFRQVLWMQELNNKVCHEFVKRMVLHASCSWFCALLPRVLIHLVFDYCPPLVYSVSTQEPLPKQIILAESIYYHYYWPWPDLFFCCAGGAFFGGTEKEAQGKVKHFLEEHPKHYSYYKKVSTPHVDQKQKQNQKTKKQSFQLIQLSYTRKSFECVICKQRFQIPLCTNGHGHDNAPIVPVSYARTDWVLSDWSGKNVEDHPFLTFALNSKMLYEMGNLLGVYWVADSAQELIGIPGISHVCGGCLDDLIVKKLVVCDGLY